MYDIDAIKRQYMLNSEEFEELYNNVKRVTLLGVKKPEGRPTAIMTGGQPGSGKTTGLIVSACKEYKDLVVLDMDHYRGFFKKSVEIAGKYPELYQEITGIYASKILEKISNDVIEQGYNFILEGTMGKSVYTIDLLQQKKTNYRIIAKILAVSREESLFSMFERYLEMKKNMGIGRLTTVDAHDIRYKNLPQIVTPLENRGIEVEVYERSTTVGNLNILYKTNSCENIPCKSVNEAIGVGRERSYQNWKQSAETRFKKIKSQMEILEDNPMILEQFHILETVMQERKFEEYER